MDGPHRNVTLRAKEGALSTPVRESRTRGTGADTPPLRIALVAPPWFSVPPTGYGGIERVVSMLADGLAARGHDVVLFAPEGSRSQARVVTTMPPMHAFMGSGAAEAHNTRIAYQAAEGFDVVHDHTVVGLAAAGFVRVPVVHTVHGAVLDDVRPLYAEAPSNVSLVAISESQRRTLPDPLKSTLIYNAVDTASTPWAERRGDYLLFVGRAAPEKGPLEAIEIAERARMPLVLLLKVNERLEAEYFEFLRPHIDRVGAHVEFQPAEEAKQRYFAGAYATLFPISWEEPFGLVMIESMAAGTPVIGFRRGSVPEVLEHGVTGFVCKDADEAVAAVPRIADLPRRASRERVERLFDTSVALDRHESLYASLVRQD
jgi:glycosyltransferase involved in cell wall biosynthesis